MNIAVVTFPRLHKLHEEIIEELELREDHTSEINIKVEKEQVALSRNID